MNFYSTQAAAERLAEQVGETVDYWITRLANMRNPKRKVSYRLNFAATEGRLGLYTDADLSAFIEFEKTKRLGDIKLSPRAAEALHAFGVCQPGGRTSGRKLNYDATIQPSNDGTSDPFAQLIIKDPLLVFRLEHCELNALVADLCKLQADLDRYISKANP